MSDKTNDIVAQARALLERITGAGWEASGTLIEANGGAVMIASTEDMEAEDNEANAAFIAASPGLVAALCDENDRLRAENGRLQIYRQQIIDDTRRLLTGGTE